MGLVAWQRPGAAGYRVSHDAVVTEFAPENSCPGRYRMLMTNLDNLLGEGLQLEFNYSDRLVAEGARKFRPVTSDVPRP